MGAWGSAPWDNDAAADWFSDTFAGVDLDARVSEAFEYDDDYDRVRAACYLLAVLGHSTVWPGDLERLDAHLERGIELLSEMIELGSDFRELWDDDPEVIAAVRAEIEALEDRLDGEDSDDDDDDDDDDEDGDEDELGLGDEDDDDEGDEDAGGGGR